MTIHYPQPLAKMKGPLTTYVCKSLTLNYLVLDLVITENHSTFGILVLPPCLVIVWDSLQKCSPGIYIVVDSVRKKLGTSVSYAPSRDLVPSPLLSGCLYPILNDAFFFSFLHSAKVITSDITHPHQGCAFTTSLKLDFLIAKL